MTSEKNSQHPDWSAKILTECLGETLPAGQAALESSDGADVSRHQAGACSKCVKSCPFLQHYVQKFPRTPKELVGLLAESSAAIAYSCHYCGLCQAVCPKHLHIGELCLQHRQRLVTAGGGPLPQHKGVQDYVRWGTSPTFTLSRPDAATGKAQQVFFPGCALSGRHPHLVKAAYAYLRQRLPHTGIMLNCCGAPSHFLGETTVFEQILAAVAAELKELGAGEIIAACPHCLYVFGEYLPQVKVRSIYEVIAELGVPPEVKGRGAVFNVHDPCGTRNNPRVHEAVRRVVSLAGHVWEEMPHNRERSICCGSGGMVPAVAPELARQTTVLRLAEAHHDLITYCAACRARFATAGHPALHVLELVFNPGWPRAKASPPAGSLRRWWRRWRLKRYFEKKQP
jgi:Fe-S oxidoreductase